MQRRLRIRLVGLASTLAALLTLVLASVVVPDGLSGHLLAQRCRPGTMAAEGPTARSGRPVCVPLGQPETFADLAAANTQVTARDNAPFSSSAPGAYTHAVAQRETMPTGRAADGTGNAWQPAGTPPLCAAQTTSSACPPPGPDNGNYNGVGTLGFRTLSGRVSAFAYDPSTQGRYFASPTVGGVWESDDAGQTWRSIADSLPTQAVGAIAYDAPLHRIIAGTGDNSFGVDGITGHGVYYSDDDGDTWHLAAGVPDLALSFKLVVSPADSSGKTVYAATSKGLYRSEDGGASFSNEDLPTSPAGYSPNCAGDTTTRLCYFANVVTDVIVKSTGTSNAPAGAVIAAVGWRAGQKIDVEPDGSNVPGCTQNGKATPCLQAPQNGLYESNTGARGSFTYLPGGGGGSPQAFAPTTVVGRTALAIAHGAGQSSDAVYALVEDAQKFKHCQDVLDTPTGQCSADVQGVVVSTVLDGMYASYDFGKSWTKIMDFTQLRQPGTNSAIGSQAEYSPGIQAWYNLWVEADPTATDSSGNPTRVLFGLEEVWENNPELPPNNGPQPSVLATPYTGYPGGSAASDPWVVIGRYWNACAVGPFGVGVGPCNPNPFTAGPVPGTTTHPDQHAYAMIPDAKGGVTLLIGSDGGAYSQHVDKGGTFSNDNWGDGLNATMSALQPYDAEMAKDGTVVSGLQDNGEMKIAPSGHESEIFGGDGFFTAIDPNNSKNIIEEYTYAEQVNLSTDGGNSWYAIAPSGTTVSPNCGSPTYALFSTPIEQDPTMPGHVLLGCTQLQEATNVYADPCAHPDGGMAGNCTATNVPFNANTPGTNAAQEGVIFDLDTLPHPSAGDNIPSALATRGANDYVAYCGYCDPATQNVPFGNGIATNVGDPKNPPKIEDPSGWHQAAAMCSDCQTANGKLPERYITSIQEDPSDPNTVYVTMGGYERHWIPPGSFGEDTSNVGVGHLFVSHDHGDHFTDITGNLPDITANFTAIHNGELVIATDLGVYIQTSPGSTTYRVLGTGLPMAPVFTIRVSPANPDLLLASTYGRSDWEYDFRTPSPTGTITYGGSHCPAPSGRLHGTSLGPLALGFTRARARHTLPLAQVQRYGFDDFCLRAGWGIRVGYSSTKMLRGLSRQLRPKVAGRIVLALTANPFYALNGVHPGEALVAAAKPLRIGRPSRSRFAVGLNTWYVVPGRLAYGVLKVRQGVIQEIGLADRRLLRTRKARLWFFTSFRLG